MTDRSIHFDADVLDPAHGIINRYSIAGGFSVDDVKWAIEQICGTMRPAAASVTAFDPASDPSNRALETVVSSSLDTRRSGG